MQQLIFTNRPTDALANLLGELKFDRIFALSDRNTRQIAEKIIPQAVHITIEAGDTHKNLNSLAAVWHALSHGGATRHSLLINIGGGVVTDLGGFAAASFKRGIRFVNIPTTLLGAVDAAVGGKTGINFEDFKNEVGAFCEAVAVISSTCFFSSLPATELRSGFAEMLKHGLISSADTYNSLLEFDIAGADFNALLPLLEQNVEVKRLIVAQDPHEKGIRRALNLGHTAGHALESYALEQNKPVAHGYAVAHGLLIEMILSHLRLGFPSSELYRYAAMLRRYYAAFPAIECSDYDTLLELMSHDKKNRTAGEINFTLLLAPGSPQIDCTATPEQIRTALDLYRDLIGA